ncbi:hypothetical protein PHYSODRAFT_448567, partial [Phytophthora sojae]
MSEIKLSDVAFDKQCDSNLLSAYYLAKQGYRHLQSKTGDFLFFFGTEGKLLFAAWHLRLGHVGKDRLLKIISNLKTGKYLNLSYSRLKEIPFYCKTCPEMKDRRMSYRNMVGDKPTEPLHTLHMDTTGRLRVNRLYGSFGYRSALAVA